MPPSRYIRESIGRLRRPRTKGAATSGGAFIFTTTRPRNSHRPPPLVLLFLSPMLSVLRGSDTFPAGHSPLWSCCIPNAPVSTLDLSIRGRTSSRPSTLNGTRQEILLCDGSKMRLYDVPCDNDGIVTVICRGRCIWLLRSGGCYSREYGVSNTRKNENRLNACKRARFNTRK